MVVLSITTRSARPCVFKPLRQAWKDLDSQEFNQEIRNLHKEILVEYAEIAATVRPGWKRRLTDRRQRSFRPSQTKRSKRPKFHADSTGQWLIYVKNWERWVTRYQDVADRLKMGLIEALFEFPHGCFLPTGLIPAESLAKPP